MTLRLDPAHQPWMTAPETRAVMDALSPDGGDQARFVGGCVRNAIMGHGVDDIDIATQLTPEEMIKALEGAGIRAVPTGLEHGTITAVVNGKPYEITSLRRDVETLGRRAVVAFTRDWGEDAARRDFRLNSIYARTDGRVFDPFNGVEDARAGRVVFIGNPRDRLAEDVLRILRFYRFNAWYGSQLDPDGHAACQDMASHLPDLAAERVWKELKKLLSAPDPGPAVKAMHEGHVLSALWSEPLDLNLLLSLIKSDRGKARKPDPLLRTAALAGGDRNTVSNLSEQMKVSNAERDRLVSMSGPAPVEAGPLKTHLKGVALGRALYVLGAETLCDRIRLMEARGDGDVDAILAAAQVWEKPRFPLSGKDLMAAGMPRGPQIGRVLSALKNAWIDSGFELDRTALLQMAGDAV